MEREIAKYSYIIILALIVSSIFNYLYQVVMGILLPKREFGVLGVALSIFYIASVLTQNTFSWSGTRRMSSALKMDDVSRVFRTTIAGNLTLALLASALILHYSYKSETYFVPNALIVIALIITAFNNSYVSLLRAMKKFGQLANANVASAVLKLLFATVLVILGMGAVGAIAGLLISIAAVLAYLAYNAIKIKLPPSKGFVKDMIPETFFVSIIFLGITFVVNSSIIFLRLLSGSDTLTGDYNAALTIARAPFFVTGALITVLFPYISSPNDKREEYAFQSIKYVVLFIFPICISMAVDPETWLNLFFGKKYMGGVEVLRFLSIGMGFISLAFITSSNLVAFEKLKAPALSLFTASVIQVASIYLLNYDSMLTSALSVIISSTLATTLLTIYYAKRFYFKSTMRYVLKIILAYLSLSTVFLLVHTDGRLLSLVKITASFSIYLTVLSVLGLFDEKDVNIMFSPFPERLVETIRRVVMKLNSIGHS